MKLHVYKLVVLLLLGVAIQRTFAYQLEYIVGKDVTTDADKFPYQVYLDFGWEGYCGGALISTQHVVTAAHCVEGRIPFEVKVVTGTTNLFDGGQSHDVRAIDIHDHYAPELNESFENDIAVVTLAKPITVNECQSPIPLATSDPPAETKIVVTGWGTDYLGGPILNELKKVSFYTIDNGDCEKLIGVHVNSSQLCTQPRKGLGVCYGDNGSPVVSDGKLIAIVSPLMSCGNGSPDVFTRVNHYAEFINKVQGLA